MRSACPVELSCQPASSSSAFLRPSLCKALLKVCYASCTFKTRSVYRTTEPSQTPTKRGAKKRGTSGPEPWPMALAAAMADFMAAGSFIMSSLRLGFARAKRRKGVAGVWAQVKCRQDSPILLKSGAWDRNHHARTDKHNVCHNSTIPDPPLSLVNNKAIPGACREKLRNARDSANSANRPLQSRKLQRACVSAPVRQGQLGANASTELSASIIARTSDTAPLCLFWHGRQRVHRRLQHLWIF